MPEETPAATAAPAQQPRASEAPPRQRREGGAREAGPRDANGGRPRRDGEGKPRREGDARPRREGDRGRPEFAPVEILYDRLLADPLYLDDQAHVVVARLRDLDSGTRSQLRRLYGAVRRATRAAEAERQHEFVMLRARLAYTIARFGLRSLDPLERLLLQVTRKNEARGYERFRDLFEAIVAYNE